MFILAPIDQPVVQPSFSVVRHFSGLTAIKNIWDYISGQHSTILVGLVKQACWPTVVSVAPVQSSRRRVERM